MFATLGSSHLEGRTCVNCRKKETEENPKRCSRCRVAIYCSRACQKAHWKTHKSACTFGALQNNCYFDILPLEDDVMDQLIDAYRMRVEDDHKYRCDDHGLYVGGALEDFKEFLDKAEAQMGKEQQGEARRSGILPRWWNQEKRTVCEQRAMRRDHWASLHYVIKKHDIQEHYMDDSMPMQLRMLAETVYGFNVRGL